MIQATCHCGLVVLSLSATPTELTECNCSICRRYGVLWAYYGRDQFAPPDPDATHTYSWDDRSIEFRRQGITKLHSVNTEPIARLRDAWLARFGGSQ